MKLAVIGSRGFTDYEKASQVLKELQAEKGPIELIVSGGARGADLIGENYAKANNIPTQIFYPDWDKYGASAGFMRNTDIINAADTVVAFWDGKSNGTRDSINKAKALKKDLKVITYQ